ncbi:MAG: metallophosphoesterase [Acidobacteriaceae bacterium]|nr:metallophosphoesterase [Acidobacteriaceae bacterium]
MIASVESVPEQTRSKSITVDDRAVSELLKRRRAVEDHFAQLGHTYRHGRVYRAFEHRVSRPALKLALQVAGIYSRGIENALTPVLNKVPLFFPGLPTAWEGFQILHLSDFHIDGTPALAETLVAVLESLRPDVCVLTGDYRFEDHGPSEAIYPLMRKVLSGIQSRFGVFGILGNHDSSGMVSRLEELGIQMLINEAAAIGPGSNPLWLIGVDDPFDYGCHDLERALDSVPSGGFKILLAHSPEIYREAEAAGIDLYLAGHTHAGQIRIPGIGALRQNASCPRAYAAGHWRHLHMQGYTSAGVGCSSLPVRFGCPPEIALIELKSDTGRG